MKTYEHAIIGAALGAVAASAPDIVLAAFGWRKDWLPQGHPLVRAHRFLHSWRGLVLVVVTLTWASHVLTDKHSKHRTGP